MVVTVKEAKKRMEELQEQWDEDYQDYFPKNIDKRVNNKQDLEPYLEYEMHYLDYQTQ